MTQSQYKAVMGSNPSYFKRPSNPVETVSWNDAGAFCRNLSDIPAEKSAGRVYRLPTEAEWKYACRAGTTTEYSFGAKNVYKYAWFDENSNDFGDDAKDLGDYAWFKDNSGDRTHAVGGKLPNAWGLYDMHGNVWEWCSDGNDSSRITCGGSYREEPYDWYSKQFAPGARTHFIGFRVALCAPASELLEAEQPM